MKQKQYHAITYEDTILSMHDDIEDALAEITQMYKDGIYYKNECKLYKVEQIDLDINVNVEVSTKTSDSTSTRKTFIGDDY